MPNITLSEARVKALRPRLSAYDIRDAKLKLVFDSEENKLIVKQHVIDT